MSKTSWQNFWNSDAGREWMKKLEQFPQTTIEGLYNQPSSMTMTEKERYIIQSAYQAQGMNEIIEYIKKTSKILPKDEP